MAMERMRPSSTERREEPRSGGVPRRNRQLRESLESPGVEGWVTRGEATDAGYEATDAGYAMKGMRGGPFLQAGRVQNGVSQNMPNTKHGSPFFSTGLVTCTSGLIKFTGNPVTITIDGFGAVVCRPRTAFWEDPAPRCFALA